MSATEIRNATVNEYRWLKRLALASENYFLAEYYETLIREETEKYKTFIREEAEK